MRFLLLSLLLVTGFATSAEPLRVAAPSSMQQALRLISAQFEHSGQQRVQLLFGASGKHHAQIVQGAPLHLFVSANPRYPADLQRRRLISAVRRHPFARGRLALWHPRLDPQTDHLAALAMPELGPVAMANPTLAPYGLAARQLLQRLGHWDQGRLRIVTAENVAQAFAFVHSGSAPRGFVALSQLRQLDSSLASDYWLVPEDWHEPLLHEIVLLRESPGAQGFISALFQAESQRILRRYGYEPQVP